MRPIIYLIAGLLVGVAGAILFMQSMPPKEGSAEERVGKLEVELKQANNRVAALEAADPHSRKRPGRTLADGARSIAEDIRDGKPVTPDDVFRATQPLIRDLSPLFDRMLTRELQEKFMESTLTGDKLAAYKSDSMLEKVAKVQQEADMKVTRLDSIVTLDAAQRGQVFGLMARAARDFDPAMQLDGIGTDTAPLSSGQSRQDAIMAVLRPAQRQAYEAEQAKRRLAAQQEMSAMSLTLPPNWNALDHLDF